ncbi:MAG: Asp23/Gls24 family envelope stress response protein [Dactylosporangium sp.]|nr:Asp23/Gls24 family envelope stress response protein [Dactylosporangium sp.]NNJ60937.1 Asp23/Gls24 family envelope stress response protein [Dactylosporangium sp.]
MTKTEDTEAAEARTETETPAVPEIAGSTQPAGTGGELARRVGVEPVRAQLITETGKTRIAAGVVAKISGLAAREIPGVHSMGAGLSRRMSQLRSMVPGVTEQPRQGVAVEVGEREAAIDLDIVTWYGQSIVDVSDAVRRNVIDRVESMTGLKVIEVNINIDDIFVEEESNQGMVRESRVQ